MNNKEGLLQKVPSKHHNRKCSDKDLEISTHMLIKSNDNNSTDQSEGLFKTESKESESLTQQEVILKSFKVIKIIGEGSYGKVYLVK
mmetsp:Transcript_23307/g.20683  ORF Transcript_23307/g.20683 Transcript_23307/m.20683 type:complete len:87 (+) Transcript_23307:29-289(+)